MEKELLRSYRVMAGVTSRLPTVTEARERYGRMLAEGKSMTPGVFYKNPHTGSLFRATHVQKNGAMAGVLLHADSGKAAQTQMSAPDQSSEWEYVGKEAPENYAKSSVMDKFAAKISDVESGIEAEKNKKPEISDDEAERLKMAASGTGYFSSDKAQTASLSKQGLITKAKAGSNKWVATPEGRALLKQMGS